MSTKRHLYCDGRIELYEDVNDEVDPRPVHFCIFDVKLTERTEYTDDSCDIEFVLPARAVLPLVENLLRECPKYWIEGIKKQLEAQK